MKSHLTCGLFVWLFLPLCCLPLAAQAPAQEAAAKRLEAFATQGWISQITTLRSHVEEIKSKVSRQHYQLLLAAEYRNIFECWLACDGPEAVIQIPKRRTNLLHFARQTYERIIKDVVGQDDPLRVWSVDESETVENLKRMQKELVDETVEISQLGSPKAYREAVIRFRAEMERK